MTDYIVCYCERCFATISVPYSRDLHRTCDFWMELVGDFYCNCSRVKRPGEAWTRTGRWHRVKKNEGYIGLGDAVIIDLCDVDQLRVNRLEFIVEMVLIK